MFEILVFNHNIFWSKIYKESQEEKKRGNVWPLFDIPLCCLAKTLHSCTIEKLIIYIVGQLFNRQDGVSLLQPDKIDHESLI